MKKSFPRSVALFAIIAVATYLGVSVGLASQYGDQD